MKNYNNSMLQKKINNIFYENNFFFTEDIGKKMFEAHMESLIHRILEKEEINSPIENYSDIKEEIEEETRKISNEIGRIIRELYSVEVSEMEKFLIATHIQTQINKEDYNE